GAPSRIGEGGTVALTDTATLSGGPSDATGTITFTLYGPDSTPNSTEGDCSAANQLDPPSATLNGANGNQYTSSPAISVSEPGIYHWKATYVSGDGNNSGSASDCGAAGENPVRSEEPTSELQ